MLAATFVLIIVDYKIIQPFFGTMSTCFTKSGITIKQQLLKKYFEVYIL